MHMNRSRQKIYVTGGEAKENQIEGREECDRLNKRGRFTTRW